MKLKEINKTRYRKHLNRIIASCIVGLTLGSLTISQSLIALFPDEKGTHFHWNLLGVILSCLCIAFVLHKYRQHNFMTEVAYVWELKQALNKINRKMPKIKAAGNDGNVDALLAMHFSYSGSRLLWELDDNNLLINELSIAQAELNELAIKYGVVLNENEYHENMLKQF